MPRVLWPLHGGRPTIQILLVLRPSGQKVPRTLLADTGAGNLKSRFHFLLTAADIQLCGGLYSHTVNLRRAYQGPHPVYVIRVEIPALSVRRTFWAAAIDSPPTGLDGSAGFRFLNRFTYGNFGDRATSGSSSDGQVRVAYAAPNYE